MKWGNAVVMALAGMLAVNGRAADLSQEYEKAYYLETARNQVKQAAALYKSIAASEATDENRETIRKSLLRLLDIGTARKHGPTIRECQQLLLEKTGISLQELIDLSPAGSEIHIPPGTYEGTVKLSKSMILTGAGRDSTVLTASADEPLIYAPKKTELTLQFLTLKSELASSERSDPPGCALYVKDSKVTVRGCAVIAAGNTSRSPLGIYVQGFAEADLIDSRFEGHAYPIFYGDGTEGSVKGCIVRNPGDCGFMSHAGSEVTIEGCIFTGSSKHGIRSSGGTIHVKNNLIIKNRNRGLYLGNKTTYGEICGNAVIQNGSGISAFASCDAEIENNVILNNGFSGIDTRIYGRIQVKNNIIAGNKEMGFAVFEEGSSKFRIGKNTFHGNGVPAQDYKLPSSTLDEDPEFADAENGDFTVGSRAVKSAEHGLTQPDIIAGLWKIYMALSP